MSTKKKAASKPIPPDPMAERKWEPLPDYPIFSFKELAAEQENGQIVYNVSELMRFVMGNMGISYERLRAEGILLLAQRPAFADLPYHYASSLTYYQGMLDGVRMMMDQQRADAKKRVQ